MSDKVIDEGIAKRIVEMYQAGEKISRIEKELGVGRSSIYWTLEKNGVAPSRTKVTARYRGGDHDLSHWVMIAEAQEKRIAELVTYIEANGLTPPLPE